MTQSEALFVQVIVDNYESGEIKKYNKASLEKKAYTFGIEDKRKVKELTELAIVKLCFKITENQSLTIRQKYEKLVELYKKQVNLSLRTSTSILLQQYSTPCPIAYLMGIYANLDNGAWTWEPSAGNGLLTIASSNKEWVIVNEIDSFRRTNLDTLGFKTVFQLDSSKDLALTEKTGFFDREKFEAIVTNPPFASLPREEWETFEGYQIKDLDHLMAIRALDLMYDDGKAAIIVGGHTEWDERGVVKQGKNLRFLSYLYNRYNVKEVLNIDGELFSKMGTSFNIRLILIDGRRDIESRKQYVPNKRDNEYPEPIKNFEDLYDAITRISKRKDMRVEETEEPDQTQKANAQAQRLRLLAL